MKKLVTVMWSTSMVVDLPDDFTLDTVDRINNPFADIVYKIKSNGFEQVSEADGEITDIQDDFESDEDAQKAVGEFIAKRKKEGTWNGEKAWLDECNKKKV